MDWPIGVGAPSRFFGAVVEGKVQHRSVIPVSLRLVPCSWGGSAMALVLMVPLALLAGVWWRAHLAWVCVAVAMMFGVPRSFIVVILMAVMSFTWVAILSTVGLARGSAVTLVVVVVSPVPMLVLTSPTPTLAATAA